MTLLSYLIFQSIHFYLVAVLQVINSPLQFLGFSSHLTHEIIKEVIMLLNLFVPSSLKASYFRVDFVESVSHVVKVFLELPLTVYNEGHLRASQD